MQHILTLNGGSSSIKFAVFVADGDLKALLTGQVARIGLPDTALSITELVSGQATKQPIDGADPQTVLKQLIAVLDKHIAFDQIGAVGHRIVHGGVRYADPQRVEADMLAYLDQISPYDPQHLPAEIAMIRALMAEHPRLIQVACFDTAFHRDLPMVAKLLPIPRRYFTQDVRRYGFHGLSYTYLMAELRQLAGESAVAGKVILAHLGSGASMAAVRAGKSIDTTMAFTPTAGLVMSSRTGDLDPGVAAYLAHTEGMMPDQFYHMANYESGLKGVSETSADMHDLLDRESTDPRAADAIALFCYAAKKYIGAYTAVLGGLDTLVFAGGIGENAAVIRARICDGLQFLGIELDATRNEANASLISADRSRVAVRVIKTDEEHQIARSVQELLEQGTL